MSKLYASIAGALTFFAVVVPAADARAKWADIRVVLSDGAQLADHRQYTDGVKVRASADAECFGESNPSSDSRYRLSEPTALGTLIDAASANRDLRPLLITDAFYEDFGSFGVCGIDGSVGSPVFGEEYWYSAVNGMSAFAGPNQIPVDNGDRHLWYFATGSEGAISELKLKAPVRVTPGEAFGVKVVRLLPDGSREPAEGVSVTGDIAPTDSEGKTDVAVGPGTTVLVADGGPDDVDSAALEVCAANKPSRCPRRRGATIYGTQDDDKIKGTRGPDRIECGKGRDVVRNAQRSDAISGDCEKVKLG